MKTHDELVKFLAGEFDSSQPAEPTENCFDDNFWSRLSEGLIDANERDGLIRHIADCSICRRRTSDALKEMDVERLNLPASPLTEKRTGNIRFNSGLYALAAGIALVIGLMMYYSIGLQEPKDFGIDTRGFLMAQAELTEFGVEISRRVTREVVPPTIDEADYRETIDLLTPHLNQPSTRSEALEIAVRAALSARFFDDAIVHARKWTQVDPVNPSAFNSLGLALFQKNRFSEARDAFEQAINLDPNQTQFYFNAAVAADEAGDFDEAIRHLQHFMEAAPEHPQIEQARQRLITLQTMEP